jgi:hypothetical protein
MPNSNMEIIWTPIFEWQVVKCGCENGHHKGIMCLKEIGVRAQNMLTHSKLHSQHDWGEPIWPLNEHGNLHVDIESDFPMSSKIMRQMATGMIWTC